MNFKIILEESTTPNTCIIFRVRCLLVLFVLIVIVVYSDEFIVKAVADLSALQTIKNSGSVWPIAMSRAIRMLIYRQETA